MKLVKRIKLTCEECKKDYEVIPSRQWTNKAYGKEQRKFCSTKCQYLSQGRFWKSDEVRKKRSQLQRGDKNSNWRGGVAYYEGYAGVYYPEDHLHKLKTGHVPRAVLVMEDFLGRRLLKEEVVHHINRIRHDDRIGNLMLFANNASHMKFHCLSGMLTGRKNTEEAKKRMSIVQLNRRRPPPLENMPNGTIT